MQSWQSIIDEQIYIDDTFELDENNTAFIVDGVLKSYGYKLNANHHQAKKILDDAYLAGFKLEKKKVDSKQYYVLLRRISKNISLILEFSEKDNYILKAYVAIGYGASILNGDVKPFEKFPLIFKNHNIEKDINELDIDVDIEKLIFGLNPRDHLNYLNIEERNNYITFFKYLYVFSKVMVNKLGDAKIDDIINKSLDDIIKIFDNDLSEYIKTNLIKYNKQVKDNVYILSIGYTNEYMLNPIGDKISLLLKELNIDVGNIGAEFKIVSTNYIDMPVKTITIKYV